MKKRTVKNKNPFMFSLFPDSLSISNFPLPFFALTEYGNVGRPAVSFKILYIPTVNVYLYSFKGSDSAGGKKVSKGNVCGS